jgi:tripartite-type tricarboxylate transporter receptor subunit TctC
MIRSVRASAAVALVLLAALSATQSFAQDYPSRPTKMLVGFAPGGANDLIARVVALKLAEMWGQPVLVENRGGAAGTIAADFTAKAPTDGYTLFLGGSANLTVATALYGAKLPYNALKDFAPVGSVADVPYALGLSVKVPAKSVQELIKYAKANPGKLSYASSGAGSMSNLAAELFKAEAGINIVHVPYKGTAPALADLIAGRIDIMFTDLASLTSHAKAGQLNLIAAAGSKRAAAAPDLATVAEQGLKNFAVDAWYALVAPANTPPSVVTKLNGGLRELLRMPDVKERFDQLGYEVHPDTPQDLANRIRMDIEKYSEVIRAAGIKADL